MARGNINCKIRARQHNLAEMYIYQKEFFDKEYRKIFNQLHVLDEAFPDLLFSHTKVNVKDQVAILKKIIATRKAADNAEMAMIEILPGEFEIPSHLFDLRKSVVKEVDENELFEKKVQESLALINPLINFLQIFLKMQKIGDKSYFLEIINQKPF